jgi:DNA-binding CsgD family transcriptional regulator
MQRPSDIRLEVDPAPGKTPGVPTVVDRAVEREALDHLLEAARGGRSGALVLRGEPGIGKTALLEYVLGSAPDMRIAWVVGVESEMELAFAAVHRLLAPMLGRIHQVPDPQADALATAFGILAGSAPDRFLVGLAALNLLSDAAEEQPLLCVIDNEQWLDRASAETLAFVARRLEAEGIALVFSGRESTEGQLTPLEGLPELRLDGLPEADARELLAEAVPGPLELHVCDRIIAEGRGNPLALLELAAELTPDQLAGVSVLPEPLPLGARLEQSSLRRVRRLPQESQSLLLLLAAEPGDEGLFWRAADRLGIGPDAVGPAESEGLLRLGSHPAFRHPFVRSAIYGGAPADERQRVHRVLADAADAKNDPDRRAWHRAAASPGPDEEVAAELERAAGHATDRGGYASTAALMERAARLTPDASRRAERSLMAAEAELAAGAAWKASAVLDELTPELIDKRQRVRAQLVRGAVNLELGLSGEAPKMLLTAAHTLEPLDRRLARETHLEALVSAIYAGRLGSSDGVREAAQAARSAPPVPKTEVTIGDLLLDGFASLFMEGHAAAAPTLRRAIETLRQDGERRWLGLGCHAALELWDDGALHALATAWVQLAREAGAFAELPSALSTLGGAYEVLVGRLDAAETCVHEALGIKAALGNRSIRDRTNVAQLIVSAWRGHEDQTRALAADTMLEAAARGQGMEIGVSHYALAVLEIGLGRYRAALTAAEEASEYESSYVATSTLPELVEAAALSGEPEVAASAARRLADSTLASGTNLALGVLARSRALATADGDVEELCQEAIDRLKRCRAIPQLARARLVYGEWLRRERRRRDARRELKTAHQMFASMGAEAFAERTRLELAATGTRTRKRAAGIVQLLTPQEARIARLAAEGASNREIAAQLLISPRTVEYHLHKVFRQLGVSSRTQLAGELLKADRGPESSVSDGAG